MTDSDKARLEEIRQIMEADGVDELDTFWLMERLGAAWREIERQNQVFEKYSYPQLLRQLSDYEQALKDIENQAAGYAGMRSREVLGKWGVK